MPVERLLDAWEARGRSTSIDTIMRFAPDGLLLGAGTVVVPSDATRRLRPLDGDEGRILALLSAAYGRPVRASVLGHIDRAAKQWHQGEDCLALIHLALAGLHWPSDRREAARRLFMADGLMKAGVRPRTILEALALDTAAIDPIEKVYNPAELRIPQGSGAESGEWARAVSVLANLAKPLATRLGAFAARLDGPVAALGLFFFPPKLGLSREGEVKGQPGLHYAWDDDETTLYLTHSGPDGVKRTFTAELGADGLFHDTAGRVVGRTLPGDTVVIDPAAVSHDLIRDDTPKLCPAPGPDKFGRGIQGQKDRDYEDYVKRVVNPDLPTPRGWGVQLPNPEAGGKLVFYDDCQRATGVMIEAKGTGYARMLASRFDILKRSIAKSWLNQSGRQLAASGGRRLIWYFAEPEAAAFARKIFADAKDGRENILIEVLPWKEGM